MILFLAKTARLVASLAANTRYAALSALLQLLLHPAAARDCSQPGHCAQLSLQAANGGDVQRQLIFVHVAKTGGTSVLTWAGGNYGVDVLPRQRFHCFSTLVRPAADRARFDRYGSRSFPHCPGNYWAQRNTSDFTCVIRHPVDRVLSAYNMGVQHATATCNSRSLNAFIVKLLSSGDPDNFDVPVAAYPCDAPLCLNRLAEDLAALLNRSFYMASFRGKAHCRATNSSCSAAPRPKTLPIVLPTVRRGAAGRCTANDLSATARAHIALRYADDLRLYAERCDAEALVKARADAPKGVEPIPAPYTWVQSGYVTGASGVRDEEAPLQVRRSQGPVQP